MNVLFTIDQNELLTTKYIQIFCGNILVDNEWDINYIPINFCLTWFLVCCLIQCFWFICRRAFNWFGWHIHNFIIFWCWSWQRRWCQLFVWFIFTCFICWLGFTEVTIRRWWFSLFFIGGGVESSSICYKYNMTELRKKIRNENRFFIN